MGYDEMGMLMRERENWKHKKTEKGGLTKCKLQYKICKFKLKKNAKFFVLLMTKLKPGWGGILKKLHKGKM